MILVVRSRPNLARTVAAVRELRPGVPVAGMEVSVPEMMPVGEIPSGVTGLVLTSVNGVDSAVAAGVDRGIPVWCVGPATAAAAELAGFTVACVGPGDAAGMAAWMRGLALERQWFWHLRAENAGTTWYGALEDAGHRITGVPAYRSAFVPGIPEELLQHLAGKSWQHSLLMSVDSARHLLMLLEEAKIEPLGTAHALSEAVAEIARPVFPRVVVAEAPTLPALLATL